MYNILQYSEGDKRPIECKGPSTDVSLLISKQVKSCAEQTFRLHQVPTTPSGQDDKAYVDVSELFNGATVNFKIPNSQWLVDHNWINEKEKDEAFLIEKLEVYLPTAPTRLTHFTVTADPILGNQLHPHADDTEYMIVPHASLTTQYDMGPEEMYCQFQKISNPYTSCETEQRSSLICPSTTDSPRSDHVLYPSLYSQWAITIEGGERLTPPKSVTDISVIFGIKLCKVVPQEYNEFKADIFQMQENDRCCPSG